MFHISFAFKWVICFALFDVLFCCLFIGSNILFGAVNMVIECDIHNIDRIGKSETTLPPLNFSQIIIMKCYEMPPLKQLNWTCTLSFLLVTIFIELSPIPKMHTTKQTFTYSTISNQNGQHLNEHKTIQMFCSTL